MTLEQETSPGSDGWVEASLLSSPYHQHMGFQLASIDAKQGIVEILLPYGGHLLRVADSDQIHGGVIASLIDIAGTYAFVSHLNRGVPTVDLRIDYLRPAGCSDLIAKAVIRRNGRRIGVSDVEVHDRGGKLIAMGRCLFSTAE